MRKIHIKLCRWVFRRAPFIANWIDPSVKCGARVYHLTDYSGHFELPPSYPLATLSTCPVCLSFKLDTTPFVWPAFSPCLPSPTSMCLSFCIEEERQKWAAQSPKTSSYLPGNVSTFSDKHPKLLVFGLSVRCLGLCPVLNNRFVQQNNVPVGRACPSLSL